jgi:hypothetical protein
MIRDLFIRKYCDEFLSNDFREFITRRFAAAEQPIEEAQDTLLRSPRF